jgi:hypothetical protein
MSNKPRNHFRTFLQISAAGLALACGAEGSIIQNSATLPPPSGVYGLGSFACVPAACIVNPLIGGFTNIVSSIVAGNELSSADTQLNGTLWTNSGGMPGMPVGPLQLTGPISFEFFGRDTLIKQGTFLSQITFLDLSGTFGTHTAEIMLNPAMPTLGQTSIVEIGNSTFRVDSFFDVFTELSIDGGPFVPGPGRHFVLVPEPGTLFFAGIGILALTARRAKR